MDMQPTFMMSLKIYWSLAWRGIVAGVFVIGGFVGISFLILMLLFGLEPLMAGLPHLTMAIKAIFGASFVAALIIIFLYLNRWIYNCLPEIKYKEGSVIFMKHTEVVKKFTVFDAICVSWSQGWRAYVLIIPIVVAQVLIVIAYHGIDHIAMYQEMMPILNIIAQIFTLLAGILALKWMIARKKEGRWIRLEARKDTKAE